MPDNHADYVGSIARRFLTTAFAAFGAAFGLAWLLIRFFPWQRPRPELPVLPPSFLISTALLAAVSFLLERAVWMVRRERQSPFRTSLLLALIVGGCFTSVQAWGLSSLRLYEGAHPEFATDESAGVNSFLFLFAFLHAMHVTVGILFLVLVTVRANADRYDHEYFWGVRLCAWYWHALGIVWLVILAAFGLAAGFLYG